MNWCPQLPLDSDGHLRLLLTLGDGISIFYGRDEIPLIIIITGHDEWASFRFFPPGSDIPEKSKIEMPEGVDLIETIRITPNTEFARVYTKAPYKLEIPGEVCSMNTGDWVKLTRWVRYVPNFFHPEFMHLLSNWQNQDV